MAQDASYIDPMMTGEGIEGIDALIAGPDVHHDRVSFSWSLAANGSDPVAIGGDFAS